MSKYYGIDIRSANIVRYGDIHDMSLIDANSKIAWFVTEESAIRYADKCFQERLEQREVLPELFEHETSTLPGIAFLYMEDNLPKLMESRIPGCIGIGGVEGLKNTPFVYCPPPGFDSASDPCGHRQFLYYTGLHTQDFRKIVEAYDKDFEVYLPKGYQPQLVPTEASQHPRVYVHYGNTKFNPSVFEAVYTISHDLKPQAGFWASPTDAKISWYEREYFRHNDPNGRVEFTLKPDAKVFMVQTLDDIAYLLKNYPAPFTSGLGTTGTYVEQGLPCLAIDFEAMSQDYDGLDLAYSSLGNIMGVWDCDSVCVFNPDIMKFREIELVPVDTDAKLTQDELDDIEEEL